MLAGCLSSPGGGGGDGGDGGGGGPSVSSRDIRTNSADCASAGNQAASINSRDGTVIVAGILSAPNPCHSASLASAEYDADADRLTVSVEAVEDEDAAMCTECVGAIDYNAEIGFSGGLPGEVRVNHDGKRIATGAP